MKKVSIQLYLKYQLERQLESIYLIPIQVLILSGTLLKKTLIKYLMKERIQHILQSYFIMIVMKLRKCGGPIGWSNRLYNKRINWDADEASVSKIACFEIITVN